MTSSYNDVRLYKRNSHSFLGSIMNKVYKTVFVSEKDTVVTELKMKYVDILRGEELINDIKDTYLDYYPDVKFLDLEDIVAILFKDFLNQIKSGNQDHQQAVNFFIQGKNKYMEGRNKVQQKKEVQQVSSNTFIFEEVEELDEPKNVNDLKPGDTVYLSVELNTRDINRVKVFLYDVEPLLNGEILTTSDIITIRYLNFIDQIRNSGNNKKVIMAILKNLGYQKALE